MKVIYVVSPDYLEALYTEAKNYTFCLQGYGNFYDATKGLLKTNISDILGFCYVGTELFYEKSDTSAYLETCNMLCRNNTKKFIFALQNSRGLADVLKISDFKNLNVSYLPDFEILTDTVINKQLFGSILLDNYSPYLIKDEQPPVFKVENPSLQYQTLFSDYVLQCLNPIDKLATFEDTKLNDNIYQEYINDKSDIAYIRECKIKKLFDMPYDKKAIIEIIEKREEVQQYCIYRALASEI